MHLQQVNYEQTDPNLSFLNSGLENLGPLSSNAGIGTGELVEPCVLKSLAFHHERSFQMSKYHGA